MPQSSITSALARLPLSGRIALMSVGLFTCALSWLLWPHWRQNPDLLHAVVMPLLFLLLCWESRRGVARYVVFSGWRSAVVVALAVCGLVLLGAGGLYAAMLGWSHTLVAFLLTAAYVLFLAALWCWCASDGVRLLPLNWTAAVCVGLWILCAPLPPGTYSKITLTLQLWLSEALLRTLHLLGVAAGRVGNVIALATTSVGVEDACSGVRSLLSCLFTGLFFSAVLLRRTWPRIGIVAFALPLALGMNFLRSLVLTLAANSGRDIRGAWHDVTGYAVLGVTAVVLLMLATWLEKRDGGSSVTTAGGTQPESVAKVSAPASAVSRTLAGVGVAAAVLIGVFFVNTRHVVVELTDAAEVERLLPTAVPGWQIKTNTELFRFRGTLHTDHLWQRTYYKEEPSGLKIISIYLAYWPPGAATVSSVALHTPDACWPGGGWVPDASAAKEVVVIGGGRELPRGQERIFTSSGVRSHVWFWHLFEKRPIPYDNIYSPLELLRVAWNYGFRRDGAQHFIRISSNLKWTEICDEEPVVRFLAQTSQIGL